MIYFIESGEGGPIKIGYVEGFDPAAVELRKMQMQVGNPSDLRILATRPGGIADEQEWHRHFAEGNIRGEWFVPDTPGLQDLIVESKASEGVIAWQLRADGLQLCEWCEARVVEPPRRALCSDECARDRKEFRRLAARDPSVVLGKTTDLQGNWGNSGDGGNRTHDVFPPSEAVA